MGNVKGAAVLSLAVAGAILWGCDSGGAEEAPWKAEIETPAVPLEYENGHPLTEPESDPAVLSLESELLRLVNTYRASLGLNALVDSPPIRDVARAHARHMILHGFVGHVNPEGDGAGVRLTAGGVPWELAGENLAAGYATPQEVFDAWMASPGHREVLESPEWTHAGAGYACDPDPAPGLPFVHFWTMNFVK